MQTSKSLQMQTLIPCTSCNQIRRPCGCRPCGCSPIFEARSVPHVIFEQVLRKQGQWMDSKRIFSHSNNTTPTHSRHDSSGLRSAHHGVTATNAMSPVAACTEVHTLSHAFRVEQLTSIPAGIRKIQFFMIQLRSSLTGAFFLGSPPKPWAAPGSCDSGYMVVPSGKPLGSSPVTQQGNCYMFVFSCSHGMFLTCPLALQRSKLPCVSIALSCMLTLSAQQSHKHGKDKERNKRKG